MVHLSSPPTRPSVLSVGRDPEGALEAVIITMDPDIVETRETHDALLRQVSERGEEAHKHKQLRASVSSVSSSDC